MMNFMTTRKRRCKTKITRSIIVDQLTEEIGGRNNDINNPYALSGLEFADHLFDTIHDADIERKDNTDIEIFVVIDMNGFKHYSFGFLDMAFGYIAELNLKNVVLDICTEDDELISIIHSIIERHKSQPTIFKDDKVVHKDSEVIKL